MIKEPRIGVLDIETAPMRAYVWGLKDQNLTPAQIERDWSIIAFTFKWLGGKDVVYVDLRDKTDITDDRDLLELLWILLDKADIIITQNGKKFDSRRINARFIMHGIKPPSPYKHLDTYLIAKNAGDFSSNKLEYLTDKLCTKYKKLSHSKYPGWSLWLACMNGDIKAWNEMKRYNIRDVLATEELYMKLRAWAPQNAPSVTWMDGCKRCGEAKLTGNGIRGQMQRRRCLNCGAANDIRLKGKS